jgi:uncharacterized protein (TIGR02246 family)
MMKHSTLVTTVVLGILVVGCGDQVGNVQPLIEQMNVELEAAYLEGDAARAAALFTEDAVLMPNEIENIQGRENIQGFLQFIFRSTTVLQYDLEVRELERDGSTAYELGVFSWASSTGQDTTQENGRYSMVRKLDSDGAWRIHRLLENADRQVSHPFMQR